MSKLKFSVITPTYNNKEDILSNINSIKNQTFKNYEHIIIDGYSDKEFHKILSNYDHLKVFNRKRKGIYDALNYGIKKASGDIFLFLSANDFLIDHEIFKEVSSIFKKKKYDLIFGKAVYTYESKIIRNYSNSKFSEKMIKKGIMPAHTATFFKKDIFDNLGLYDLNLTIASDFEFYARIIKSNKIKNFKFLNKNITSMKIFGKSSMPYSFIFNYFEKLQALKKNNYKINYFKIFFHTLKKIIEFKPIINSKRD
jgi:glycosyltransferase involved in cell wall biosynthesis